MKNNLIPERDVFAGMLSESLGACGISISAGSAAKIHSLAELLTEYNSHTNLTAITEPELMITRHFADSLSIIRHIPEGASIVDVGSGAGFPALPVAIARPDVHVTAVESTAKKCAFIAYAAGEIGISNISVVNRRAEDAACDGDFRERFDIATARAVAALNVISELCIPFVKAGGAFIAMKSQLSLKRECDEAENGIGLLGGEIESVDTFEIPEINSKERLARAFVIIRKISSTKKNYPRKYAQIIRKPL